MLYEVITLPAYFGGANSLVNPLWLVLSYFVVVIGELCLSPVGLSARITSYNVCYTKLLRSMERDGLIESKMIRQTMGRPTAVYGLTDSYNFV